VKLDKRNIVASCKWRVLDIAGRKKGAVTLEINRGELYTLTNHPPTSLAVDKVTFELPED
jgi:hypothetical protein